MEPSNNAHFYHFDSRGSTVALTDATGQTTDAYAYDPFGVPRGTNGFTENRFRYLGRHGVVAEENGLSYVRARYYSARHGRFVTKDPITGKDGDSQSLNRYIYALNNPVRLIDISGLSAQEAGSGTRLLATSDNSRFHNYLISPATGGFDMRTAGSTPSLISGGTYTWNSFLEDSADFGKETLKEFGTDVVKYSTQGAIWAWQNGYKSLAGLKGGATGFLESKLGGVKLLSVVRDAAASFTVDKVLDKIEGKGHSVPGVGFLPLPTVWSLVLGGILRGHDAGETFDDQGNAYFGDGRQLP
jgi:RHS repeat-associated protein